MASGTKLMDEIYDQFLLCKICYEAYKRPKTLSCLHTFCEVCLEKHQDAEIERSYRYMLYSRAVSCPICRKKTEMPSGGIKRLPDNFLVANLNDVVSRRKPLLEAPLCEICQSSVDTESGKTATSKCLECSKLLCKSCNDLHRRTKVTQAHTLFDIEVEKDIECKVHKDEVVRFYCERCEMCICVVCTFQEHKGHDVSSFTEGMETYRNSLDSLVGLCRERIGYIKDHIDLIGKCESEVKKAEDQIRDTTIDTIAAIRKKEQDLMERLYSAYGTETFEYFKEKTPLQETLETLQSTCTLTDIITKDQNIELLLLKKDIQEKLKLLLQRKLLSPPDGMGRQVRFTPGHLVFGSLVTDHRPAAGDDTDDVQMTEEKGPVTDMDIQTDTMVTSDQWTSMGQLIHNYNNEQLTQTDKFCCISRGCSPMHVSVNQCTMTKAPDVKQQCTMTVSTPVMKRKIQTDSVTQADQITTTIDISTSDKFTNTLVVGTRERGTTTKRQKVSDQLTDTVGLVDLCNKETATPGLETTQQGTLTEEVATLNKSTVTVAPDLSDKGTYTPQLVQNTQATMTPAVMTLDMGVECHVLGENKAVGTKTTIITHSSAGNFDVRTSDQSVGTPWGSSLGTYPQNMRDKDTYTNNFNKVDKITATPRIYTDNVGTGTPIVKMRHTGVGTLKVGMIHQSVEADLGYPQPVTSSVCAQTALSFRRDVIMPNMSASEKGVCTDHVEYRQRGTSTPKLKRKHKHVLTDSIVTKDSFTATNAIDTCTRETQVDNKPTNVDVTTRDNGNDAYRGIVHEVCTNTDFESVTDVSESRPMGTDDTVPKPGIDLETVPVATETLAAQPQTVSSVDAETTMRSVVLTTDACCSAEPAMAETSCNTISNETRDVAPVAAPVSLTDSSTSTEPRDLVCTGTETHPVVTLESGTETVAAEHVSTGNDPVVFLGDDKSTATHCTQLADVGVGTPAVSAATKETSTDPVRGKDVGSATSIETAEDATSMPQLVTATISTCMDDGPDARNVDSMDTETMTTLPEMATVETTMSKGVHATDSSVCTDRVELVHTAVDAERIVIHHVGTGTPQVTVCESSTSTVPLSASTVSTSTLHGVRTSDQATGIPQVATSDAEAVADILKPYVGKTTSTMTTPLQTADVGILKRPHTVTRGTEPTKLRRVSRGTATVAAQLRESSSMTQAMQTEDKAISAMTIKSLSKGTETPKQTLVNSSTTMKQVTYTDRESSPIRSRLVDRASSPILMETCDRESSPVRFAGCDKAVGIRAETKETYTSTARIKFRTRGTMYESTTTFVNREVSPIPELQPSPPVTAEKATTMPKVSYTDREASPVRAFTKERGTATTVVEMVDRECAPVPIPTKTRGVSAIAKVSSRGVCTPHVTKKESFTEMKVIQMTETATAMPHVSFVEKETSTPQIHTMHKNISTENISTSEKQTSTCSTDVTAAYRETIRDVQPVTVSRGTCTPTITTNTRETSPPQFSPLKDRGSSPFRIVRMVDKGISVTRGEIMEPLDRFQKVGGSKTPMKPIAEGPRPTLACIREDSGELLSSDDDCGSPHGCAIEHATITSPPVSTASISLQKAVMHRETFQTSASRLMGKTCQSTFNSGSTGTPSSILWKVEMATNTPEVTLESKGTSTPPIDKEDKAICTESITMEGKMAACISKLKNVRQRLEQQPLYSQASSQTPTGLPPKQPTEPPIKPIFLQARSKSVSDSLNEGGLSPMASSLFMQRVPASSTDSLTTASEGSDQDSPQMQTGCHSRRLGLARKQRLDISQLLLRSSSVPDNAFPPYERPRLQVQAVHAHVIPKLPNVDELKLKPTDDAKPAAAAGADQDSPTAGGPGVKPKRSKHHARPRQTQNIQDAVLDMRRNSDGGDAIRARQDRQKDRFDKLVPMRRLPALPQCARSELATTGARSSPKVRRKTKETGGAATQESGTHSKE